jgi:drug/metabolite transporter (DMT)-like permease
MQKSDAIAIKRFDLPLLTAFFAIYVLWGTTFLAIRIAVAELPPLLAAGARFFTAGLVLFVFMRVKGQPNPTARQWRSLLAMGVLMFVLTYAALFWAEKYVTSGLASVLEATIPLVTVALEMVVLRQQRFRWSVVAATLMGFCGVGVLLLPAGRAHAPLLPCLAVLGGTLAWSLGSVLTRAMDLPKSRPMTAGAAMMLGGGILLALSAASGDMHPWPHVSLRAAMPVVYLIVFGSLLGFTAFVWLLARMPATRVASHAYVNPLVAVALGYFAAHEAVTLRMLAGTALVIVSVFFILRGGRQEA